MKPQLTQRLIPQHVFPGLQGRADHFQDSRSAHSGPLGPPCALVNPLGELPKLRETEAQTAKGIAQGGATSSSPGRAVRTTVVGKHNCTLDSPGTPESPARPSPVPEIPGFLAMPRPLMVQPSATEGKRNRPSDSIEESKVCIHLTISRYFHKQVVEQEKKLCICWFCQSPRLAPPCSWAPREELTGSAWRPAATEAHCSPAGPLPLVQEDPPGSSFKRAGPVSPYCRPASRESQHRKRKPAGRGLGHSCHRRVSGGFRGRGARPHPPLGGGGCSPPPQSPSGSRKALISIL